jgi:hypothetical protein
MGIPNPAFVFFDNSSDFTNFRLSADVWKFGKDAI